MHTQSHQPDPSVSVASRPRRLYVHCGAHKTGTTLLQRSLARHADELPARGAAYVDPHVVARRIVAPLHSKLGTQRERRAEIAAALDAARDAHPGCDLVLSHESLFSFARLAKPRADRQFYADFDRRLKVFLRALDGFEPHLIFYIRRQDRFAESVYLEAFQQGYYLETFEAFFEQLARERLSWRRLIDEMAGRVGRERLTVRPFEDIRHGSVAYQQAFYAVFCDPTGIAFAPIGDARRSLSQPAYRALQWAGRVPGVNRRGRPRQTLVDLLRKVASNQLLPRISFLSDVQRGELLALHAADNAALFAEYLPDRPPDLYAPRSAVKQDAASSPTG